MEAGGRVVTNKAPQLEKIGSWLQRCLGGKTKLSPIRGPAHQAPKWQRGGLLSEVPISQWTVETRKAEGRGTQQQCQRATLKEAVEAPEVTVEHGPAPLQMQEALLLRKKPLQ